MSTNKGPNPVTRFMDAICFIRNAYVLVKHIVPFSVASLALLTLSVPKDNLLLKLAILLKQPGVIYLPAILLTLTTSVIYFITLRSLSARMYLWPKWDSLRTLVTATISLGACTAMVYGVIQSTGSMTTTCADWWACYLVAVLSLTGVGWSGLGNWIEAMGIKHPDYEPSRRAVEEITSLLKNVRGQQRGSKRNVSDFLQAAKDLRRNIDTNLSLEPKWVRMELGSVSTALRELIENVESAIPLTNEQAVSDFPSVVKYQKDFEYPGVVASLRRLGTYWHDWL